MKTKQWKRQETIKPNVHPSKNDKMFLKQEKLLSDYKKSKAKSKSLKPTMKDVAGRTGRERFRERMDMGLPNNERQRRLSKIPGKRQIRRKK